MALTSFYQRKSLSQYNYCHAVLILYALVLASLHPVVKAQYDTINGHSCFRNLDGMMKSIFDLAEQSGLVSVTDIGDSYLKSSNSNNGDFDLPEGGFDIYALNITASDSLRQSSAKAKMLIISGVHAREYAPPELAMRFAETLVDGYNVDSDITWLLRHTEIHFIVYVNPDGRYVAENYPNEYRRKNLNPKGGCSSTDLGVDINRNYDFQWGNRNGASSDPCESDYHGPSPHSEPETQAVVNYAQNLFPEEQQKDPADIDVERGEDIMGMFVDIHASGGYVYFPWGFEDRRSPDDEANQALGRKIAHYNDYKLWAPGSDDFSYPASGDGSDYMYGILGVASFGLELGEDFYEDCKLFEDDVAPDNLPALLYGAKIAKKPFSLVKGPDIIELSVLSDSEQVKVTVVASDSIMVTSHGGSITGDQGVAKVQLYFDVHPYDYNENEGDVTWEMQANSGDQFELVMTYPNGVSSGRHILYAQAMDADDYLGPVSSIFIDVERQDTGTPTVGPTPSPSLSPIYSPTVGPSRVPSTAPTTSKPTVSPTESPSTSPTTARPSGSPTTTPASSFTFAPSKNPSKVPSRQPTTSPSSTPTTSSPTSEPTSNPTVTPSSVQTNDPSINPSNMPSDQPSTGPSNFPSTSSPTLQPTDAPTAKPNFNPTTSSAPTNSVAQQDAMLDFPASPPTFDDLANDPLENAGASGNASHAACLSVISVAVSTLVLFCLA